MRSYPHEFKPFVLAIHLALIAGAATAQTSASPPTPSLTPSVKLEEAVPKEAEKAGATYVAGDSVSGEPEKQVIVKGNAELRRPGTVIRADLVEYEQATDKARATGNVRMNRQGNVYEGTELEVKVDTLQGYFLKPKFQLLKNDATGDADRADFLDDKHSVIQNARYSTCRRVPGAEWLPDWFLKASRIEMDSEEEVGAAENAVLRFQGIPILALPYLSFPLSSKRKTGMLPPTMATDSLNGFELTTPYYWNIAPNRDATLYPTVSTKRGINLGGEFRYLEPNYGGQVRLDVMPNDRLRDATRWGVSTQHQQRVDTGYGGLGLNLAVNRVSDDNYWRDFPRAYGSLTQRLLPSEAALSWAKGDWTSELRTSKWQVLQDVTAPIVPPYDRLPQWTTTYNKLNLGGFDVSAETDAIQSGCFTYRPSQCHSLGDECEN
jgi:LPS-assembly protein